MIATAMMDNPTMHRSHHEMIRCSCSTRSLWCSCTDGRESLGTEVEVGVAEGSWSWAEGSWCKWMDGCWISSIADADGRKKVVQRPSSTPTTERRSLIDSTDIIPVIVHIFANNLNCPRASGSPHHRHIWDQQQYLWSWIDRKQIWPQGWSGGVAINIFRTRPLHICSSLAGLT